MSSLTIKKYKNFLLATLTDKVFIRHQVKDFNDEIGRCKKNEKIRNFIIDFSNCDYISSEGLGALAEFWTYCEDNEKIMGLVLSNKKENEVAYLFDIIGLSTLMRGHIFYDLDEAKELMKRN